MNTVPFDRRGGARPMPALPPSDALGLRAIISTLAQNLRLVLVVFALVMAVAVAYLLLAPAVYKADTLLQIDNRPRGTLAPNLSERNVAEPERPAIAGEIEILRSRELLLPVIAAVGADIRLTGARRFGYLPVGASHGVHVASFKLPSVYMDKPFRLTVEGDGWQLADTEGTQVAAGNLGEVTRFQLDGKAAQLEVKAPPQRPRTTFTLVKDNPVKAHEDVLERLRAFEPSRESNVVRLSYEDTHAGRAAELLNRLVATYLERAVYKRASDGTQSLTFMEGQLPALKSRMEAAEDALEQYQKSASAVPLPTESEALMRERNDLDRQIVTLQIKRDELSQTLTPQHPDLAAVIAQLNTVKRAAGNLGGNVRRLPAKHRDVTRLQREVQVSTQLYTSMLSQVQQARIAGAGWVANARLLDVAAVPVDPVRPRAAAVLSIGAGLAFLLALGAAMVRRSLRPMVSDLQQTDWQNSTMAELTAIPESASQQKLMDGRMRDSVETDFGTHRLLARAAPQDPAVESLRSVLLTLLLKERDGGAKVIMVTSPMFGVDKGFVAANLAALIAETGKRVLLIESDMRRPTIHRYVELDRTATGLSDLLCGTRHVDEVIYPHATANLDVMLHGTMIDNPGGLLMSQELELLLAALRDKYDHIVLDAAPVLPVGDALAVGRVADCALLVVHAEQSLAQEAQEAARRLERAGVRLESVLFNDAKRGRAHVPQLT